MVFVARPSNGTNVAQGLLRGVLAQDRCLDTPKNASCVVNIPLESGT